MKQKFAFLLLLILFCRITIYADEPKAFSMPDSTLLFGQYGELRRVTAEGTEAIKPPKEAIYKQGYFAYPSISRKGDLIAWPFIRELRDRPDNPPRFMLGVYSIAEKGWKTYGDFDDIGQPAFSPDGSQIAFVADRHKKEELLLLDVSSGTMKSIPHKARVF